MKRMQGAILLAGLGKCQEDISIAMRVPRSLVSYWLSGQRIPNQENRNGLRNLYGIPQESWESPSITLEKVTRPAGPLDRPDRPARPPRPPPVQHELMAPVERGTPSADRLVLDLRQHVHALMADVVHGSPIEKANVFQKCAATLTQIGRWTGETLQVTEAKILATPEWRSLSSELMKILEKYPEAMTDVRDFLQSKE
jgi:transcriptional regulator with XRE-family HTH domain